MLIDSRFPLDLLNENSSLFAIGCFHSFKQTAWMHVQFAGVSIYKSKKVMKKNGVVSLPCFSSEGPEGKVPSALRHSAEP